LLPMLETIHVLICKFAQKKSVCVWLCCNIKIYQGQLYFHYSDPMTKYVSNIFKKFQDLVACNHNICSFEMEGNFIKGWILVFWTIMLHILGDLFKYQWQEGLSDSKNV
jgi:CDP-diglyceride synthetase